MIRYIKAKKQILCDYARAEENKPNGMISKNNSNKESKENEQQQQKQKNNVIAAVIMFEWYYLRGPALG